MLRSAMWLGPDGIKDSLRTYYGLEDAEPIWTEDRKFGNICFIFQAEASPGKVSYYIFDAIADAVALIGAQSLDEIRDHINEFGEGEKTIGKLKLTELIPK